jgi:flagellar hook assembly protein FlgD
MIDPKNPCGEAGNWTASAAPAGGTPGKLNSVNASRPDLTPPQNIALEVIDAGSLLVLFPEKTDSLAMAQPVAYSIGKGIEVAKAAPVSPQFRAVLLTLTTRLAAGTLYTISVSNVRDCAGNIGGNSLHTTFALPERGDSGDVVLNEVLFNPRSGGVDFVEIYNRSGKYVSLKDWQLATFKDGQPDSGKKISEGNLVLPPRQYAVMTTSPQVLKDHYPRAKDSTFIVLSSLPSYPDDAGSVVLLNHSDKVMDRFDYDEKFHFALIDRKDGVSLERINAHSPGNTRHNWHSAASTEGYATPGYQNSQGMDAERVAAKTFQLTPRVFTPDEDGYNDFTTLHYQLPGQGNVATVSVYDGAGREVKKWIRNELLGTEGFYTWDGTDDRGGKVRTGRYIVFITLFDMQGRQQQYKEEVVVGAKF